MTGYSACALRSRQEGLPLPIRRDKDNSPCASEENKMAEICLIQGESGQTQMQQARCYEA